MIDVMVAISFCIGHRHNMNRVGGFNLDRGEIRIREKNLCISVLEEKTTAIGGVDVDGYIGFEGVEFIVTRTCQDFGGNGSFYNQHTEETTELFKRPFFDLVLGDGGGGGEEEGAEFEVVIEEVIHLSFPEQGEPGGAVDVEPFGETLYSGGEVATGVSRSVGGFSTTVVVVRGGFGGVESTFKVFVVKIAGDTIKRGHFVRLLLFLFVIF